MKETLKERTEKTGDEERSSSEEERYKAPPVKDKWRERLPRRKLPDGFPKPYGGDDGGGGEKRLKDKWPKPWGGLLATGARHDSKRIGRGDGDEDDEEYEE